LKNKKKDPRCRVGVHTSIAGGISKSIERAVLLDCNTVQFFSHSPRQWEKTGIPSNEAERFTALRQKNDINPVFVHASYLINLASLSPDVVTKSVNLLAYEMENADRIGAEYVVLHTGSARGENETSSRKRASKALMKSLEIKHGKSSIILENTAPQYMHWQILLTSAIMTGLQVYV